jgi:hypothetical protein
MLNKNVLETYINQNDPLHRLYTKEYIQGMFKFGAYLTIINNKKINPAALFTSILENYELRELFVLTTCSENVKDALLQLLHFYPPLLKSKNTKRLFKKSIKK